MTHSPRIIDQESQKDFVESQLSLWPMAKENYHNLYLTDRRPLKLGHLHMTVQHNPARVRSTAAKTDAASVAARPCFLCAANRPHDQLAMPMADRFELLVNPFPILPMHFTIAAADHRQQDRFPTEVLQMAIALPGMAVFFNGASAGASAPDHMHCQAVLAGELPIIEMAENFHPYDADAPGPLFTCSDSWGIDLPFHFFSAVIPPDPAATRCLLRLRNAGGINPESNQPDPALSNSFFWIDRKGFFRVIVIPRKAHRPRRFYLEGDEKVTVSPGALDMAGIMVTPMKTDFLRIDEALAREIYSEVAYCGEEIRRLRIAEAIGLRLSGLS